MPEKPVICSQCGNQTQPERSYKKNGEIWCEFCVGLIKKKRDFIKYKKRLGHKKKTKRENEYGERI